MPITAFDRIWPVILLVITLVIVGSGLRFTNLGDKVYWHDETYSSLRAFGHTGEEYYADVFDGKIHSIQEVRSYQHANSNRGIGSTLKALASRPEHPPLYYLIGRVWSGMFNDPVVALRSLSALFGLFLLPAVYWFARELFDDNWVSWTAVAVVSVSPLHLLYAQEARQYALWTTLTMISCALFMRNLRVGDYRGWQMYSLVTVLGLYTHIMFGCTAIAHATYLFMVRDENKKESIKAFIKSLLVSLTLFTPWIVVFFFSIPDVLQKTAWMHSPVAKLTLAYSWLLSVNRLFFDFPGSEYLIPVSLALVGFSLAILIRCTPMRSWFLPVLVVIVAGGAVILPDIVGGGRRSLETRYLLPSLLMLELCVAYAIGKGIKTNSSWAPLARVLAMLLVTGGLSSQLLIIGSNTWWNKSVSASNGEVARIINAADKPMLISTLGDINPGEVLSLSYMLKDDVRLLMLGDSSMPEITSTDQGAIFVLNPRWELQKAFNDKYDMQLIGNQKKLWALRDRE